MTSTTTPHNGQRCDVVVNGRRIAYLEAGRGERTCVFIHGLAASWDYWIHTIPALVETHRVIAMDLPGFGRSENPTAHGIDAQLPVLPAFLDAIGVDRCDVVGHSMGTLIACEFGARYPERVNRLVLSGGPITSVVDLFNHPLRTLYRNPKVVTFLVEALTAGIRPPTFLRRLILTTSWARWIALRAYVPYPAALSIEDVSGMLVGVGAPAVLPTLRQGFGYDVRPALTAVRQPTIIINGERDTICPPTDAHAFAAANNAVRDVHLIPDVGHLPMIEAPADFNDYLAQFLLEPMASEPTCAAASNPKNSASPSKAGTSGHFR
jgi:pimeloyl-ACP methyl ester carboxylesterase